MQPCQQIYNPQIPAKFLGPIVLYEFNLYSRMDLIKLVACPSEMQAL